MGTSENIISAVIILILFVGGGIAFAGSVAKKKVTSQEAFNSHLFERKAADAFDAALATTEPGSGRQYGDLLASSVYYHSDIINHTDPDIDVSAQFTALVRQIMGSDQTYFEVMPNIQKMDIVFLGSGVERMLPVYAVLERDLDNLLMNLNEAYGGINVTGRLVLIEGQLVCTDIDVDCSSLAERTVYNNNLSSEHELIKFEQGLLRPTGDADVANDWETLMSYYLIFMAKNKSSFEVLFPIADSLPASSATNPCNRAYGQSILPRDRSLIDQGNFLVHPILVNNGNATWCPTELVNHTNALVASTIGRTARYNQNFLADMSKIIQNDVRDLTIQGGTPFEGPQLVIERHVQLPSGQAATIRLHVKRP